MRKKSRRGKGKMKDEWSKEEEEVKNGGSDVELIENRAT